MKKDFIKIVVILLIVIIFPMTNNFCFQGLFDSFSKIDTAQAMASDISPMAEMDTCVERAVVEPAVAQAMPTPFQNHDNSLLPCCIDGNHPSSIISYQSAEIEKFVPHFFFSGEQLLKIVFENNIYNAPITSPPKLLAVKTTILRL
jgi:hypothetical protein